MKTRTMKEYVDFIIKDIEDSSFKENIKNFNVGEELDVSIIEECINEYYYYVLDWCGCGEPETAKDTIRKFLEVYYVYHETDDFSCREKLMKENMGYDSIYGNPLLLCFAYAMDAAKFTEHGFNIHGAWITERGMVFYELLELYRQMTDGDEEEKE